MISPYLSIIIPAFNEENRLPKTLEHIFGFLAIQEYDYELIVIENGSQDRTFDVAKSFSDKISQMRVIRESNRGKGQAVKRGMLEAQGEYLFMCDADLSMPIDEVNHFLPPALEDFDIAIGSREADGAVRFNEPAYRHIGGRVINYMIQLLALPGLQDTQCGFKCFRQPVAKELFNRMTIPGWSFDVEILYLARIYGYRIIEVPINWYFNPASKVNLFKDSLRMLIDIMAVRKNFRDGIYIRESLSS